MKVDSRLFEVKANEWTSGAPSSITEGATDSQQTEQGEQVKT